MSGRDAGARPRGPAGAGRALVALALGTLALSPLEPAGAVAAALVVADESPVTAINLLEPQARNSPMVAVDPTDSRFAVVAHRVDGPRLFDCGLHVSGDAGRTWQPAQPVPALPAGVDRCYGPEVAFDRSGALHFLFVGLHGPDNRPRGAYLTTSVDRGRSFSSPREVLGPDRYSVRMAIGRGAGARDRVHLVWVEPTTRVATGGFTGPTRILAASSDDGGQTLSAPVVVSEPARRRVVAPAVALGRDRHVHVAYYDLGDDARDFQGLEGPVWDGQWAIALATSSDGGATFSHHAEVATHVPAERVMLVFTMAPPALAADRSGAVYVAWTDGAGGDWDVRLARIGPPGDDERVVTRVNDDVIGTRSAQYLPRLSVAPSGRVDALFYDRRDDPSGRKNHVYLASSTDGGRTFSPNRRVSSEPFFWEAGVTYPLPSAAGMVEFGSRLGLVSSNAGALAAWTDTRMVNRGNRVQDVYSARLTLENPGSPARAWWPVAVAIIAAAGAAGSLLRWRQGVGGRAAPGRGPSRRRRLAGRASVVAALGSLAGCGGAGGAGLPPSAFELGVVMREYGFDHPGVVEPGRTLVRVRNGGSLDHELVVARLPDDFAGSLVGGVRIDTRLVLDTVAIVTARGPGASGLFALDLRPGRYAFMCFVRDDDGVQHHRKGMTSELRVAGHGAPGPDGRAHPPA